MAGEGGAPDESAPVAGADAGGDGMLAEVTVTATHRAVSANDLPLSISVMSGATLQDAGIADVAKLTKAMAGVDYTDKGPFSGIAGANLIIRGLNSEATGWLPGAASPVVPPVATYVDDTPLFVNLRLQDLSRVEVLRGPQGTLYGSGSLGGTLRFVQNEPDPSGFDVKVDATMGTTAHTSEPNGSVNGVLNIPLSATLALRANAGWAYDAGYVNQPNVYRLDPSGAPIPTQAGNLFSPPATYAAQHTNDYQYHTGRMALMWKPDDIPLTGKLSYYYQLGTAGGFPYIATGPLAYTQPILPSNLPAGTTPASLTQLYNATLPAGIDQLSNADNGRDTTRDQVDVAALDLTFDLGFATLTSSSSWAHHANQSSVDETDEYVNFSFSQSLYGQNPRMLVVGKETLDDKAWTQELRLVSSSGGTLEWLAGLFYRDQQTNIEENDYYPGYLDYYNGCSAIYGQSSGDGVTPHPCGLGETAFVPGPIQYVQGMPIIKDDVYINAFDTHFKDMALFGDLTGHLTSAWSVTAGARVFKQTLLQGQRNALLFDGPTAAANVSLSDSWRRALWKLNTTYKLDHTNLVYATWSQGFRRGSVNALPPTELNGSYVTPAALAKVSPDTADNYEVGFKGTIQNRFRYSAALFDIQWHNIQEGIDLTPLVLPGALNIGDGFSRGFEFEAEYALTSYFSANASYTYDRTKFTHVSALFYAPNSSFAPPPTGGPLPGTPLNSLAVGLQYGHVPMGGGEWTFGANAHYQSSVMPLLSATAITVPGYTMLDARLSYARDHWSVALLGNNLTNNLGITSYQDPALFGNRAQAIISQPRTFALRVSYSLQEQ